MPLDNPAPGPNPRPMHPNPAFRGADARTNLAQAAARGFGVLAVNGTNGPLLAHVPFVLAKDGRTAALHLVRSNPIWRALGAPLAAVIAITGPDGYISPDWYGVPDQVPTWNYVAVHLRGRLEAQPAEALPAHLDALAANFEARLAPKPPWTADKMTLGVRARMQRMIAPCRLHIDTVDGTWKLGQNKGADARRAAADGIGAAGLGQETQALAALMIGAD